MKAWSVILIISTLYYSLAQQSNIPAQAYATEAFPIPAAPIGILTSSAANSVDFDSTDTRLLTGWNDTFKIWRKGGQLWGDGTAILASSWVATQSIRTAIYSSDRSYIAGAFTDAVRFYSQTPSGSDNYTQASSIPTPNTTVVSISWSGDDSKILLGMGSGMIGVYQNQRNGSFQLVQNIKSNQTGDITVVARGSKFVSCGNADTTVKVWIYNSTTNHYVLNQTLITNLSKCTALDLSLNLQRIVVGDDQGNVLVYQTVNNSFQNPVQLQPSINGRALSLRFNAASMIISCLSSDFSTRLYYLNPNTGGWVFNSNTILQLHGIIQDWANDIEFGVGTDESQNGTVVINRLFTTLSICNSNNIQNVDTSNNSRCSCTSGEWINGWCTVINCSSTMYGRTNGVNANSSSCICVSGYVWSSNYGSCVKNCSIANATGALYDSDSCVCSTGFVWSGDSCITYVNCSNFSSSTGQNIDAYNCQCKTGFSNVNDVNGVSTGCGVNCTLIKGNAGPNPTNISQCYCQNGLNWNDTFQGQPTPVCYRSCTGSRMKPDSTDPTICQCDSTFSWNNNSAVCVINCKQVSNSTGSSTSDTSCECVNKYNWDAATTSCTKKKSNHAVAIACGIAIPLGVLALLGLIFLIAKYTCYASPTNYPMTSAYPPPIHALSTTQEHQVTAANWPLMTEQTPRILPIYPSQTAAMQIPPNSGLPPLVTSPRFEGSMNPISPFNQLPSYNNKFSNASTFVTVPSVPIVQQPFGLGGVSTALNMGPPQINMLGNSLQTPTPASAVTYDIIRAHMAQANRAV